MSLVTEDGRPIEDLRVVDLKEELERRGLNKNGKKTELFGRLKEAILAEQEEAAAKAAPVAEPEEPVNPMIQEYLAKKQKKMQEQQKTDTGEKRTTGGASSDEAEPAAKATASKSSPSQEGAGPEEADEDPPKASSPEPKADSPEPKAASPEPKAASPEPKAASPEPKADSPEPVKAASPSPEPAKEASPSPEPEKKEEAEEEEVAGSPASSHHSPSPPPAASPKTNGENTEPSVADVTVARKRKWGSTSASKTKVAIDSSILKDIATTAESLEEGEEPADTVTGGEELELDYDEGAEPAPAPEKPPPSKRTRIVLSHDKDESPERSVRTADPASTLLEMVTEEGLTRAKSLTPPRHESSNVVQIRGLTRPFTLLQLHALLGAYGSYAKDTDFWIDNIKSHCLVKYATPDEARAARDGLHNVRWPQGNPKMLRVDFSADDKLEKMRAESKPAPRRERDAGREIVELQPVERTVERTVRREIRQSRDEREWDRGKRSLEEGEMEREVRHHDHHDHQERRRHRDSPPRREREASPRARSRVSRSPAKPVKTLEDLFSKTKTLPCLYWLPIEESRMEERAKRRAEDLAQQEERRKAYPDEEPSGSGWRSSRDDPWASQRNSYGGGYGGGWGGGGGGWGGGGGGGWGGGWGGGGGYRGWRR